MPSRSSVTNAPPLLLDVKDMHTKFFTSVGVVHAVRGVTFGLREGEILGLVGESGCGKSVTARSVMRLVPRPGRIVAGEVWFEGTNLLALSDREMRAYRGRLLGMIFQNPMSSLNPVHRVGAQLMEAMLAHRATSRGKAKARALELLDMVGIPDKNRRFNSYPHELSGGMCQRIMIAMAMTCRPRLLIADEATTALDVTIQNQILVLLKDVCKQTGTAMILITHDMSIVAETCQSIAVMYAGRVVEMGTVAEVFRNPVHPYTQALLRSIPGRTARQRPLDAIDGHPPSLAGAIHGCAFAPRCSYVQPQCHSPGPSTVTLHGSTSMYPPHSANCILAQGR